jgi:hypothetical protein
MPDSPQLVSKRMQVSDSLEEINEFYYRRGWTDGLPIVPPTEERVVYMLTGTTRKPGDIVGKVPPLWSEATVEKVAINAVMAGCSPEYMPVIITALDAMLEKKVNLYGIQATTHPVAPLIIINGPIRNKLELNSGYNVFGQGNRANATIGRAIRLILLNIGGGTPGKLDRATMGQPSKYTFCIAENEERNPWQPLHVERGFDASVSTVTVCGAENPWNINDHSGIDAESILTTIAGSMTAQGCNNTLYQCGEPLVVIGPEHAATIASSGFSKQDVKHFLFEKARVPKSQFSLKHRVDRFAEFPDGAFIPVATREDAVMIIVAGGAGKHSMFMPTFADTLSVTKEVKP